MNIRLATLKDLGRIDDIYNQAVAAGKQTADTEPWSNEQRLQWFNEHSSCKYPVYVAEIDGIVAGYIVKSLSLRKKCFE